MRNDEDRWKSAMQSRDEPGALKDAEVGKSPAARSEEPEPVTISPRRPSEATQDMESAHPLTPEDRPPAYEAGEHVEPPREKATT